MRDSHTLLLILVAGLTGALVARWSAPTPVLAQASDSGYRYVAATCNYMEVVSILYVLDQHTEHLVFFVARGGAPNAREVVFVGARNISLDTLLPAFNDESEFSNYDFKREFEKKKFPIGGNQGD